jgi:phenylalanyl-tRNA synthetase beta chain
LRFIKAEHTAMHPGRCAQIECDGKVIGVIGELHPRLQQKYDLPLAPVMFEVELSSLQQRQLPNYREISKFQAASRDLAFVVKNSLAMQEILDVLHAEIKANDVCKFVQAVVLFDEYRGKGLELDEKSLAFRFTLQDTHNTLQDEQVEAAMSALINAVQTKTHARLR